jgi:hypothetical protein
MGAINSYLNDTCNRVTFTKDKWGTRTATVETEIRCRIDWGTYRVLTSGGVEVVSNAKVTFQPSQAWTYEDEIEIENVRYKILKINQPKDFNAISKELFIG